MENLHVPPGITLIDDRQYGKAKEEASLQSFSVSSSSDIHIFSLSSRYLFIRLRLLHLSLSCLSLALSLCIRRLAGVPRVFLDSAHGRARGSAPQNFRGHVQTQLTPPSASLALLLVLRASLSPYTRLRTGSRALSSSNPVPVHHRFLELQMETAARMHVHLWSACVYRNSDRRACLETWTSMNVSM